MEKDGSISDLADMLFRRGHKDDLFMLNIDCDEKDLPSFCGDLFLHGVRRLVVPEAVDDPTCLTGAQFAEIATCMRRAGVAVDFQVIETETDEETGTETEDSMSTIVEGTGGCFRLTFRTVVPS